MEVRVLSSAPLERLSDRRRRAGRQIGVDVVTVVGLVALTELEDREYGSRDYSARDFEGNRWSFGTDAPR